MEADVLPTYSLDIGMIGVIWAVSIIFMGVGLIKLRPASG